MSPRFVIAVTQAVLKGMRARKSGVIVNISSVGGRMCYPFGALYHGSKWAVEGLSEALHYELAFLGIRVKLVEPGGGVPGAPEDLAALQRVQLGGGVPGGGRGPGALDREGGIEALDLSARVEGLGSRGGAHLAPIAAGPSAASNSVRDVHMVGGEVCLYSRP